MALPYQVLKVCGNIVFAARGCNIYSFNSALECVSAWKYPVKQETGQDGSTPASTAPPTPEGPPTKRRRVEPDQESASNGNGDVASAEAPKLTKKQQRKKEPKPKQNPPSERPFIQGLYATSDCHHIVAITGSDKTIWVFEHDGAGRLKHLSNRMMSKRPCALAITTDNKTILSADKFGDVYGLDLLSSEQDGQPKEAATSTTPKSRSATPLASAQQALKPQADELTVHTLRNLKALENQKITLQARLEAAAKKAEAETRFEHPLLLGHVSMLTAVVVGVHNNRDYIITADRDEHIRVSRGIPQAHVIEEYCLAHEEFVSRICIPSARPEILISGGGDDDLFVWDWLSARLLSRVNVLKHAQDLQPETSKIAVTRILAYEGAASATSVLVICERIPAVFCFELKASDTRLQHSHTIPIPGGANPLDVEYLAASSSSSPAVPRLLVAVDPNTSSSDDAADGGETERTTDSKPTTNPSLLVFSLDGQQDGCNWRLTDQRPATPPTTEDEEKEASTIPDKELQKILYTTENLRKTAMDYENE
ncbi:hypothetical protein B0H66DRAFT_541700 [Apodospora peruviana]|uniref:Transfer RNA methyltransferase 82 n=1 Tax=Apodospora peruviana TaxID=516989 RepID=A0AAE0MEV5_9PEZI|nr:hypothetical protein B0H66DRAFT_541700 [Apodospora peruviana]